MNQPWCVLVEPQLFWVAPDWASVVRSAAAPYLPRSRPNLPSTGLGSQSAARTHRTSWWLRVTKTMGKLWVSWCFVGKTLGFGGGDHPACRVSCRSSLFHKFSDWWISRAEGRREAPRSDRVMLPWKDPTAQ